MRLIRVAIKHVDQVSLSTQEFWEIWLVDQDIVAPNSGTREVDDFEHIISCFARTKSLLFFSGAGFAERLEKEVANFPEHNLRNSKDNAGNSGHSEIPD